MRRLRILLRSSLFVEARSLVITLLLAGLFLVHYAVYMRAQSAPPVTDAANPSYEPPAESELARRIEDASAARSIGNPEAIGEASRHLAALALRELGELKLAEFSYPQSIELYRNSLDLDNVADTRVDLAISDLDSNQLDRAIAESKQFLAIAPEDFRANSVLGLALMRERQYRRATEALSQAVKSKPDIESMYFLAECLLASDDPVDHERTSALFRRMIATGGDSASIHLLFGRLYTDVQDFQAAIPELQRAVQLDSKTPHAYAFLALARLEMNQWKPNPDVKSELLKEIENHPADFLANYLLGVIASEQHQFEAADRYLSAAAEASPAVPEPWLYIGLNAYARGDKQRAEQALRKAVELTGNDEARSNCQIRRAYVDLAQIVATSRKEEAETFLAKARNLPISNATAGRQRLTRAAPLSADDATIVPIDSEAEDEVIPVNPADERPYESLKEPEVLPAPLSPEERNAVETQEQRLQLILAESFNDLATSEALRGQYWIAYTDFENAQHWNPNMSGLAKNLGLCAFRQNNFPAAIDGLSRALGENPEDAPVRAMLGMAYFANENFAETAETFQPLDVRGMQDPSVGYAWAASLAHIGNQKKASEVLQQFEQANPAPDRLLLIGQLWTRIGDYPRAVEALHRALLSNPSLLKVHSSAGLAYSRWHHWSEAAAEFEAELALSSSDPDATFGLGFVYFQQGKKREAAVLFQKVLALDADYATERYETGKLFLDRDEVDEAVPHLEAAEQLNPQAPYVHYQLRVAYEKCARPAAAAHESVLYDQLQSQLESGSQTK